MNRSLARAITFLFLFASTQASIAQEDELFRTVPLDNNVGFEVGRGYDILKGNPRADCVDRSVVQDHPSFGPNSATFHSTRIENSEQLDRALSVSASASVQAGSWGGSASAAFSNSLSVTSYGLTYLVSSEVDGKGDSIRDVKLKDRYLKLISSGKASSLARFRDICGDGYIGEFTMGGLFQAVVQIHTRSQAETESLAATVGASFTMASGSASFSSSLKKIATTNEVKIWTFQRGGAGPIPLTPDEMAAKAAALPDSVKSAATPTQAAIFSYIMLLEDPDLPLIDFTKRERAFSYLSERLRTARDQEADLQYILDHPNEFYFSPADLPRLANERRDLDDFRTVIEAQAQACAENAGDCTINEIPMPVPTSRPARR
ncbi:hypothetical protein [Rhizobium leguminosarum]|uniref:hypothetical protein n=1 Tax=Rhizobium leguminosarum TaxID=384 RepID=UPI00039F1DCD|nr:hypothetical protein [Rhizobium leguminosarum]